MVARGAGAAGPVLLACRQWDPLGLARWLPSLGVEAWRSAPLLPCTWCTWCCVSPVSPFPPCVSRAVCGGPSCLGVPYPRSLVRHSTRSEGSASSVRLPFWYSPRALCVCVRSRSRGVRFPPPLPWVVWRAHLARSRRLALVGPFHAVRAPPRVVPRSLAPSDVLGEARPSPVSPLPGFGLCAPRGVGLCVRNVPVPGAGVGGRGGGLCTAPPVCAGGEASGAGGPSASFGPSAFPGQATKRVSLASFWSWRAWPPYSSGLCSLAVSGRGLCGALARWCGFACSPRFLWEQAAGAGGWALLWPPSRALRSRQGEGGTTPSASGGWGPAPPRLAGRRGGGGGCAAALLLSLWGAARDSVPCPPSRRRRIPPGVRAQSGSRGRPVHRVRPAWRGDGGGEGRPVNRPPGGPVRPKPSLRPPRVGNIAGVTGDALAMWDAAPILFWFVTACRTQAWSARRSGALVRARPSAATPAGAGRWGRWGARRAGPAASPPPASWSLLGEGGRPLSSGGPGGEWGGGGPPPLPAPCRVGFQPAILCLRRAPLGYPRAAGVAGRPWASGAARSAASGSVQRGGGGEGGGE